MFSPPPQPLLSSPPPPSPTAHDHGHDHSLPKFEMELTFAAIVLLAILLCCKQCSNTNETQPRTQQHDIELGLSENTPQADHHVRSHHVPDRLRLQQIRTSRPCFHGFFSLCNLKCSGILERSLAKASLI
nr:hypothetical protein CFP56_48614 [Quercus suber]